LPGKGKGIDFKKRTLKATGKVIARAEKNGRLVGGGGRAPRAGKMELNPYPFKYLKILTSILTVLFAI
jgi:hypothetical protein